MRCQSSFSKRREFPAPVLLLNQQSCLQTARMVIKLRIAVAIELQGT